MKTKIAIQGFKASFHEAAARKYFGKQVEMEECLTFDKLFEAMQNRTTDIAVMAIENSVAGAILPNYARLRASNLEVIGEVYLRIEMNFMALKGQELSAIKEVHSHPIALLQCKAFLKELNDISIVESNDTALSAQEIAERQIVGRAAIASEQAAELYGLEILGKGIETNKRNFTRFLVLKRKDETVEGVAEVQNVNKASWSFRASHLPGSLAKILTILGEHQINLTKIQSLPVLGEEWKYYFYADLEFKNSEAYQKAKSALEAYTIDLKILGEYEQGIKYL